MKQAIGTNRDCANFCENGLLFYLNADNAPFTTTLSFPPFQSDRMGKPEGITR